MENKLELIATELLDKSDLQPHWTNRTFMNALIIFQTALMDKMYDNQNYDNMDIQNRMEMANQCGNDLRKLIHTYTNLDTHDLENFL